MRFPKLDSWDDERAAEAEIVLVPIGDVAVEKLQLTDNAHQTLQLAWTLLFNHECTLAKALSQPLSSTKGPKRSYIERLKTLGRMRKYEQLTDDELHVVRGRVHWFESEFGATQTGEGILNDIEKEIILREQERK